MPFLYYGNEIGMRQLENLPQIEGCYKLISGARTPMQWTGGEDLGSSIVLPLPSFTCRWIQPPTLRTSPPRRKIPNSLLNRVRKLIWLKHTEPALAAYAEFVPLYARENTYPFVYARASGEETLLMIFNPAARAASAEFSFPVEFQKLKLLAGKEIHTIQAGQTLKIEVPGLTYAIYQEVNDFPIHLMKIQMSLRSVMLAAGLFAGQAPAGRCRPDRGPCSAERATAAAR